MLGVPDGIAGGPPYGVALACEPTEPPNPPPRAAPKPGGLLIGGTEPGAPGIPAPDIPGGICGCAP
jgi:hypothetical protein